MSAIHAAKMPADLSYNEEAMLMMAAEIVMTDLSNIGLPCSFSVSGVEKGKESHINQVRTERFDSTALHIARTTGFVVFAIASPRRHDYIREEAGCKPSLCL